MNAALRLCVAMAVCLAVGACSTVASNESKLPLVGSVTVRVSDFVKEVSAMRVAQYRPDEKLKAGVEGKLKEWNLLVPGGQHAVVEIVIKDFFVGGAQYGRSSGQDRLGVEVVMRDANGAEIKRFEEKVRGVRGLGKAHALLSEVGRVDDLFKEASDLVAAGCTNRPSR